MLRASLIVFLAVATTTAHADTSSHMRLLLHGTRTNIGDTGFGIGGWITSPDITVSPSTWLGVAGPRFDGEGWNMEFMAGGVIDSSEITPLIDLRLEITPDLWNIPLYSFANVQWIDPTHANVLYLYTQFACVLPDNTVLLGLETENVLKSDDNVLSVGPQLVVPLGALTLVAAYQLHPGRSNQFWLRAVLTL